MVKGLKVRLVMSVVATTSFTLKVVSNVTNVEAVSVAKRKESFAFFQNKECEYYPCHEGVPEEDFNCLFCYCPLMLLDNCGGDYVIMKNTFKDCSSCTKNHDKLSWKFVVNKLRERMDVKVKFTDIGK